MVGHSFRESEFTSSYNSRSALSAVDMNASILCVGAPGDDATDCTARIHSIVEAFKLELNNFHEGREARNADRHAAGRETRRKAR